MGGPQWVVPLAIWVLLCFMVGKAAEGFNRPAANWFLAAVFFTPLLAFIVLQFVGDPVRSEELEEKAERIRRRHPERKDIQEAAMHETNCPHCGAAINSVTEDGLHSSSSEPWLLICNECNRTFEPD